MTPCFGYIRVSTKEQADGASLDAQKDAITAFASQNNLTIIKWFEEQETASKTGRPLFETMRRQLIAGKAKGVVIHRIDRSSRNYTDWAHIDELSRQGIKLYFAADGLDFESTGGRLMADIQMVLAAHYSRNLSFEVKKGLYGRIKQGYYPFRAPIGYLDNGEGQLKTVDPIKGPLVRLAFELYCSGEYSITSLTKEMAARGLTGWGGKPVVRRNIETMLRNPFYLGKMLIQGTLYDAVHPPLITATQFQQVRNVKAGRSQKKQTKHQMTYRGLLVCTGCGKTLTGERQKVYIYYRCHTSECFNPSIREDRLVEQLAQCLTDLEIPSHDKMEVRQRLHSWLGETEPSDLNKSILLRIADANSRLDRLTDLLVEGTIDKQSYELRRQNTAFELERLREEEQQRSNQIKSRNDLDNLLDMACKLKKIFAKLLPPERRAFLKNCAEKLIVENGQIKVIPAQWLTEFHELAEDSSFRPTGAVLYRSSSAQPN